ncbi:hypothetical protein [Chryseobacterium sp.]|uniref:hypothetical protein n=1 Tax=Chryseobacterium sp. TaxID=1871047 RepID=UPI0025BDE29B|nr:hypothetical protein [Chryseobacterium sp.]MBV8325020.1 hypothetical protein [Chryseobacterium sp.]
MKKLFFALALGFTGLMSANMTASATTAISTAKMTSEVKYYGGWCEIKVYRINGDGSQTLVSYSYSYVESESACNQKAQDMLSEASSGLN